MKIHLNRPLLNEGNDGIYSIVREIEDEPTHLPWRFGKIVFRRVIIFTARRLIKGCRVYHLMENKSYNPLTSRKKCKSRRLDEQ
jgi:hypothetical protein